MMIIIIIISEIWSTEKERDEESKQFSDLKEEMVNWNSRMW